MPAARKEAIVTIFCPELRCFWIRLHILKSINAKIVVSVSSFQTILILLKSHHDICLMNLNRGRKCLRRRLSTLGARCIRRAMKRRSTRSIILGARRLYLMLDFEFRFETFTRYSSIHKLIFHVKNKKCIF